MNKENYTSLLNRVKRNLQKYYARSTNKSYRNAMVAALLEIESIELEAEKLTLKTK